MIRVDLHFGAGDFRLDAQFETDAKTLGVFGPSGAGKTTLAHCIAGVATPPGGRIEIGGRTLLGAGVDIPIHKRDVGLVFQEARLFPHLNVRRNLLYGAPDTSDLDTIVGLLELESLLQRRIHDLSGGEKQRVAIGRAILSKPQILILDEPLASLDRRLRRQILPFLVRVRDALDIPMLYISHELDEILQLTTDLLVMDQGRIVGLGPYADIIHDDPVLDCLHDRGMTNILRAELISTSADDGVSLIDIGKGTRLSIAPAPEDPGSEIVVGIRPWDIALAAAPVSGVSIQNQATGTISRLTHHERRVLVEIDLGAPVIAEISRKSAAELNLGPGRSIVCLIKSHAIRRLSGAPEPVRIS